MQWWGRDRPHGRLPVELLVHKQTRATAETVGLLDRGLLAPGHRGDVNVIDFDGLRLHAPEFAYDLPAGGRRLLQRADGYQHTFVAGTEMRDGRRVDRRHAAGRLVRGASQCGERPSESPRREERSSSARKIGQAGSSRRMWLRLGSGTNSQSGMSAGQLLRPRAADAEVVAGVQDERRALHLRRHVGDVDLGERLEEAHRVLRVTS